MNIGKMMQQAKEMQGKMQQMQSDLAAIEVCGEAGGGMVTVRMTGNHHVRAITIDDAVWDDQDKAMIEDLIAAATNAAAQQVAETIKAKQSQMMAGLPIPPGFSL
ncbi:MAG: YbaB/EbfC family nucleoid-associated protein [Mariprofundales bacterium]